LDNVVIEYYKRKVFLSISVNNFVCNASEIALRKQETNSYFWIRNT